MGQVKSEPPAVRVSKDGGCTKAAAGVGDKWVDSEYSLVAGLGAFLMGLEGLVRERGGEDDPNVGLRDW